MQFKSACLSLLLLLASFPALAQYSATLSWTPPTTRTDGTAITGALTYDIYYGPSGNLSVVPYFTGVTGSSYLISFSSTVAGTEVCFAMTAIEAGVNLQSAQTNVACKTFTTTGVTAAPIWPSTSPLTVK